MINFETIDYLKNGNPKQQKAFRILTQNKVIEQLTLFAPILVGTIPIEIDIESSDLDVICQWTDKQAFTDFLIAHFGHFEGFKQWTREVHHQDAVIASFMIEDFEIEIFGQSLATKDQFAYRHMIIEHQLLLKYGEAFRAKIIALKKAGLKTEPAFAKLLGLEGDPYLELLKVKA